MTKEFTRDSARYLLVGVSNSISQQIGALSKIRDRMAQPLTYNDITDLVNVVCKHARVFATNAFSAKLFHDWLVDPQPEWFDHFIDQYRNLAVDRNALFAERGVYGMAALKQGGRFLELCCGDGFNAFHFYSPFASSITAVDFDEDAIKHASTHNAHPSITYLHCDVRQLELSGPFSNVIWDAAIEHFTEEEIASVMTSIKSLLDPDGVLSGYTIVENSEIQHPEHEREFRSKDDLADFLTPHFANVRVLETRHQERHNLYFFASDAAVPFDEDHPASLVVRRRQ